MAIRDPETTRLLAEVNDLIDGANLADAGRLRSFAQRIAVQSLALKDGREQQGIARMMCDDVLLVVQATDPASGGEAIRDCNATNRLAAQIMQKFGVLRFAWDAMPVIKRDDPSAIAWLNWADDHFFIELGGLTRGKPAPKGSESDSLESSRHAAGLVVLLGLGLALAAGAAGASQASLRRGWLLAAAVGLVGVAIGFWAWYC